MNKKQVFDAKNILAITINGKPLLQIHNNQKKTFYNYLLLLSQKYKLIIITDMSQSETQELYEEIGLTDGFMINNCGSSIFDIKNKQIIMVASMKKNNMLPIYRQTIVDGDSIIIHSHKKIFIYTHYLKLHWYLKSSFKKSTIELIENYDDGIKIIMRNKIESLEVINTFYNINTIETRNKKIYSICEVKNLIYNEINTSRILIIDSGINQAIDFIMKEVNMQFTELFLINLTGIFRNQNITSSYECNSFMFMEELFEYRTFYIFDVEFKKTLIDNNFISYDEIISFEYVEVF